MFDPVGAVGFFRKEAPLNLVASLGSGLKEREAMVDGVFDGLVVTEFEVQEAVVLEASPVTSEEGIAFTVVDASGAPFLIVPGHNQYYIITHGGLNLLEKMEGEIGSCPLFVDGREIKTVHYLNVFGLNRVSLEQFDVNLLLPDLSTFPYNVFPPLAFEPREEIIEFLIILVQPVKLEGMTDLKSH